MTLPEVAQALRITTSQAEYGYKQARHSLAARLEELVRAHVGRYCTEKEMEAERAAEWGRLKAHLQQQGGLEEAVRRTHEVQYPAIGPQSKPAALSATLQRMSGLPGPSGPPRPV